MEAAEIVLKALRESGKPMKAGEIAAQTGADKAEIDKAIKKLKKEEKISSPKVCYYEISK